MCKVGGPSEGCTQVSVFQRQGRSARGVQALVCDARLRADHDPRPRAAVQEALGVCPGAAFADSSSLLPQRL